MTNKTLYNDEDENSLRFSSVEKHEGAVGFKGFSVKYVIKGNENYFINNHKFKVNDDEYVVGNNESKSIVEINSKNNVDGICIDVSEKTIKEITHYHFENPKILEDFLFTEKFLVNKYNHKNTQLGGLIKKISKNVILEPTEKNFNKELFYEIAEKIILDQSQIFEQYDKLKFVKKTTNEVIYRQLYSAKELIDNSIEEKINIGSISQNIGLSEYHFIRLFKTVFGKTPYHYLIERRLNIAKEKIINGENISEVALNFAYMDLQSFSKSFKKMFGKSPSQIIKNQ